MTRLWCNTVLVAFSAMQKIVKDYDFAFKSRLQSSFMSVHLKNGIPTQTLVKEMLEINRRKLRLLILRDTVNTALCALPPSEKDILVRRFRCARIYPYAPLSDVSTKRGKTSAAPLKQSASRKNISAKPIFPTLP